MPLDALPAGCEPACHGCRHRLLTTAESAAQKTSYLARALHPWAQRLHAIAIAPADRRLAYRDRATLTARWSAGDGWQFGLVRRDELIPIHDCPVHTARVRALVHALVERLPPGERLPLAYLHVSGAQATLIVKTRQLDNRVLDDVPEPVLATGIEGLWLHLHPAAGRRLFARSGWTLLSGVGESRGPLGLLHGPTAFMQALPELHARAMSEAANYLSPRASTSVLDLYCGLGATLKEWSGAGAAALGIELSGEAVEFARQNAPGASVLRGTCAQRLPQIREWWAGRGGERVAYVNPPRSGLEAEVTRAFVQELRPLRLAYLSCSGGTLARDLVAFETGGYDVVSIRPYDFFPNTHHVEALALLERR